MTRVVFGIMSAFQRSTTVSQLVSTLGGRPVVIHHDFNQRPDFRIDEPNVTFVPNPAVTGWGTWGFCEAIVRTLEYCLAHVPFDYFQLLSPTCLPLRPIDEFESYVTRSGYDGNVDLIELTRDRDVMMTFGWRFLAPRGTLKLAALRRARSWYFSRDVSSRHRSGLSVLVRRPVPGVDDPAARFASFATRMALQGWLGGTPFHESFRPFVGSCWFGATRPMAERIIAAARTPSLQQFFEQLPNTDESFFPTVMGNSGLRLGPSNHLVNFFNDTGNPHWLRPGDLERIVTSGAYFARKFPDDPRAQVRLDVIDRQRPTKAAPQVAQSAAVVRVKRQPRLAFGVLSATSPSGTVAQLARSLAPYPVIVHHDFAQQPDFSLSVANVSFVPKPWSSAEGTWSWTQGVLELLQYCVDHVEFDYLQLLSSLCLPVRPIARFADHIASSEVDAHAGIVPIAEDDALMSFGYRLLAAPDTRRRRWLERARDLYFGDVAGVVERAGVPMPVMRQSDDPVRRWGQRAAESGTRLAGWPSIALPLPDPQMKLFAGAPWFGATREVCDHLVKRGADPDWIDYFRAIDAGGDVSFATLLGNSGFRLGPSNHIFSPFDGARQRWIGEPDATWLVSGDAFFARKFSHDPDSPIRLRVLAGLGVADNLPLRAMA